ncbi:hypothetical protein M8R20_09190 [Pseudomonas sp. R2.Fl]|nr:hypothetical protein [Pseudomonas sp. R2.Fl]
MLLEICVDDPVGLGEAIAGGADRIELCSALSVGGLTPSRGFMAAAARSGVPVHAMIRPREGDFVYDAADAVVMLEDIRTAREAGLAGIAIGASRPDGSLDIPLLRRLVEAAAGMQVTLHRAFDLVPDFDRALEEAISLGCSRVLTSGGASIAPDGIEMLRRLAERAGGRIGILPGGGIRAATAASLLSIPGITELHASCSTRIQPSARVVELGFSAETTRVIDREAVARLKRAMSMAAASR